MARRRRPDIPPDLCEPATSCCGRGDADVEWLIDTVDPNIVITQIAELPDSSTYRGPDGFVDALLDWPRQWQDFQIEPRRVFAVGDDHLVDRGAPPRPAGDRWTSQVEAEIVFLMRWRDRPADRLEHVPDVTSGAARGALGRAAERGAHRDDDHAAERDRGERAQEAGSEEPARGSPPAPRARPPP